MKSDVTAVGAVDDKRSYNPLGAGDKWQFTRVMCLICMDVLKDRNECTCGNAALITDDEGTYNLYVEDIRTTRLVEVYYDKNGKEVSRQVLPQFDTQPFINYYDVKHTHINFPTKPVKEKGKKSDCGVGKHRYEYDRNLMRELDRYSKDTAAEKRIGTTRQVAPKRYLYK